MSSSTRDLVIFDNDGVLIDSEKLYAQSNAELLTALGYPTSAEECERRFTGVSDRDLMAMLLEEGYDLPPDFIQQMYDASESALETELQPVLGVRSVVKGLLDQSVQVAVASNAPRANVIRNLRITGYDDLLPPEICFSGLDVHNPKPAPDLHKHILHRFNRLPRNAIVVEDSPTGAQGACAADVAFIGVLYAVAPHMKAQRRDEFRALGAYAILDTPAELNDALGRYLSQG